MRILKLRNRPKGTTSKTNLNIAGIYCILNIINNKMYFGSAKNIRHRKRCHYDDLKNNRHHSIHLQRAFNKYGEDAFLFIVIQTMEDDYSKDQLLFYEQFWMESFETYNYKFGYNIYITAGSCAGIKLSDERKKQLLSYRLGSTSSLETRKLMSKIMKGRLKGGKNGQAKKVVQVNLNNNIIKEWDCIVDVAREFNLSTDSISKNLNKIKKSKILSNKGIFLRFKNDVTFPLIYKNNRMKPIVMIDSLGNELQHFLCVKEASRELNICDVSIYSHLNKGRKLRCGLKFKFMEVQNESIL